MDVRQRFINPEFVKAVGMEARYEHYHETLRICGLEHNRKSGLRAAHIERVRVPYLTAGVERYERVASYCAVEARHPLLDRRFVELCISMPWNQLCRNGWSKFGLRQLAAELVPSQVAWRRDGGGLDWQYFSRWMRTNRQQVIDQLMSDSGPLTDWIDWAVFSKKLKQYMIDADDVTNDAIWRVYCLKIWIDSQFRIKG